MYFHELNVKLKSQSVKMANVHNCSDKNTLYVGLRYR